MTTAQFSNQSVHQYIGQYQVRLDQFAGPLALLLHLIRKEEMNVYDIPIHRITGQYLEYIRKMKELDLEVAGEFVAMAATLIHIKSRLLLPQYDENGEEVVGEDPRKELVQKLLEYQKYQMAAQRLVERPLLGRDFWLRGRREDLRSEDDGEILIEEENALFAMIGLYRKVVNAVGKRVHHVAYRVQSIAQRIFEMQSLLKPGVPMSFSELMKSESKPREKVLITFLSLLELGRMGFVSLFQSEPFAEIHIDVTKPIEQDVIARVDEFDSSSAAAQAAKIFANAENTPEAPSVPPEVIAELTTENTASDEDIANEELRLELQPV